MRRTFSAAAAPLLLCAMGMMILPDGCQAAGQGSAVRNAAGEGLSRIRREPDEMSSSSSSSSLLPTDAHTTSFRRSLRKQVGDCKGSKFQIVIRFDAYPEDFAMQLVNDDNNRTVWEANDPKRTYKDAKFRHATVAAGVCLPREWCWVLTVYDKNGDGMVGNDLTTPGNGGGFRLLLNGATVNYYTGKYNGCYKKLWFRFGEWCGAEDQFGYEPGDESAEGCGNFTAGRAPDDGWFPGDLYQVGTAAPATRKPTRAPVPSSPRTTAPVRVEPTDRPVPTRAPGPVVGPTDMPVGPTDRPQSASPPPTGSPSNIPQPDPAPAPAEPVVAAPAQQPQPARPTFCHFRYCF